MVNSNYAKCYVILVLLMNIIIKRILSNCTVKNFYLNLKRKVKNSNMYL